MKPQELRLGNYVKFKDTGENQKWVIHEIDYSDFELMRVSCAYHGDIYPHFKPIKIDITWLEKFGFTKQEKDDIEFTYMNLPFAIHFLENRLWKVASYGYANHGYLEGLDASNIEYVHELQNLYFALTKEELFVKELV